MSNERVEEIAIEKLAQGGDGLAHLPDGRVLFVEGGVPGDVVDVEIMRDKKSWARGRVVATRQASKSRVNVECDAFERSCGGCQYWGVNYADELQWKVDAAWEAMRRISGLDVPKPRIVEAPSVWDYRNRVTFHQRRVDGTLERGFYAAGSRRIVAVERCPVARPAIDEAIAELGGALGLLGTAEITVETAGEGTAVALIELGSGERIEKDHLEELARRVEQGTVVRGVEVRDEHGEYYIIGDTTVEVGEVLARPPVEGMRVESGRFRQVNRAVNRRLVDYVVEAVGGDRRQPRIVELYCGAGNFSFPLADIASDFVGFEGSRGAVETARQMAALAENLEEIRFEVADLADEETVAEALERPFEVLVLDPPREGADVAAEWMARSDREGLIVYVACDPACLARDIATLADGGWTVVETTCFDMFPRTAHLETVAILEK